ncbi:MAG TPA: hypothetical protein VFS77_01590, partial [Pyrinomonadaceae bacterium]|nr:hypothetical protein [Pyrinomonadaceae bacterium]
MRDTKTWLASVAFTAIVVLLSGSSFTTMAQHTEPAKKPVKRTVSGGRDPFKKYEPPRVTVKSTRE